MASVRQQAVAAYEFHRGWVAPRWSVVVGAYQNEQINLGKAAELLGLTELELRDRFIELGFPLRIGPADLAEARAETEAVRAWYADEAGEGNS